MQMCPVWVRPRGTSLLSASWMIPSATRGGGVDTAGGGYKVQGWDGALHRKRA